FVWARHFGGSAQAQDRGQKIALDGAGNVYTTGWFQGTADFDPGPGMFNLTSPGGGAAIFVAKLDSSGNFTWARAMCGNDDAVGYGFAVDRAGNVYTTGNFHYAADFDPGPGTFTLTTSGTYDDFVSKLDSNGTFAWAVSLAG